MNISELIEQLLEIKDKEMIVLVDVEGEFIPVREIEVNEWANGILLSS